ncbi:MAG TPA: hypothetical protein ACFCUC_05330 [Desulfobacterales bacterium]|jgi:hypothetical protein
MIAYFVHDSKNSRDIFVIPEMGCSTPVDRERMQTFIAAQPDFSQWSGTACGDTSPEDFGTIVATRDDCGDVVIVNEDLWRKATDHYLGGP